MDFCLSYLNDKILKGFGKGMMTGMILIDLQKVFDTIDHDIVLRKLLAIGFLKHAVDGFRSYLSNRSFMINLESNCLQPASVSYGLPKGSILGLLLFLIYGCQHEDFNKTENQLNEQFSNICDWLMDKKRSIHFGEDKTK